VESRSKSSVFGNSVAAGMLSGEDFNAKKLLFFPAVLDTIFGVLLIPFSNVFKADFEDIYDITEFLMSFLGMIILELWLSKESVTINDFRDGLIPFLSRILVIIALVCLMLLFFLSENLDVLTESSATLYLICLPPPAANIVVT